MGGAAAGPVGPEILMPTPYMALQGHYTEVHIPSRHQVHICCGEGSTVLWVITTSVLVITKDRYLSWPMRKTSVQQLLL